MPGKVLVLGIDPGTLVTGFGLVEQDEDGMRVLAWSSVASLSSMPLAERLTRIHAETVRLIEAHRPDEIAVENVFHSKNVKSALTLGHARGVTLLAAAQAHLPIFEYAPREVKLSVVGNGNATKQQVAAMVGRLLSLSESGLREDESDAVAVAICHLHKRSAVVPRR
ncbi:MAG: crossover junction endodeoxyribonuclease RuvC [Candidatus Eisenbacteria bacterium]|nr:crossover junction endodeoxyribonuclease RuvC [Candidatus Eisenbacteria bacterium]